MTAELILAFVVLAGGQSAPQDPVEVLVGQLGAFQAAIPGTARGDGSVEPIERRRQELYSQLMAYGQQSLPALGRGLAHSDVQIRRNVALFLNAAGGSWYSRTAGRLNLEPLLPILTATLRDNDPRVRELTAQAIGVIGPAAVSAVPALVTLLADANEGSRNTACIALAAIGPAARQAIPALRRALSDPSADVRDFAQRALDRIDIRGGSTP